MKTKDYFAQDPTVLDAALEALTELMQAQPELNWAALVDSAFDYSSRSKLTHSAHDVNCYGFEAYAGLEPAAPWLIPITNNQVELKKLMRHCSMRPMLSFVASHQNATAIAERWKDLHWANTPDSQRVLLRIADTRVLPSLPAVLLPTQWSALAGELEHWLFIDRRGVVEPCQLPAKGVDACLKIELTQLQLDQLMLAGEADAVVDLLTDNMPDVIPQDIKRSDFYALVCESCNLAHSYQVEVFSDMVSIAVAACLTQGVSNKSPVLHKLLQEKQWDSSELGDAMLAHGII